jgi:two-component system sensor histidine kinase HydH
MNDKYFKGRYAYLVAILLAASIIIVASAFFTFRNSTNAAADSLKLQSLGIAVSLEAYLKDSKELLVRGNESKRNIFKEIITEGRWEGIAFIALYDRDGLTVLHSNENLIGRQVQDKVIKTVAETGNPVYSYTMLGTEERVFVLNSPFHIQSKELILRLALHTQNVEGIIRQARLQAIGMTAVLAVLWIVGYFLIIASKRSDELINKMAEKERLAVIGEMASVIAHEIRNPLGSIKGFAQYIREQNTEHRAQDIEALDIIVSESHRLEALAEDLLLYAKPIEVKKQEVNIGEIVDEVIASINKTDKAAGVDIKTAIATDIKIISDKDKLKQILMNIIFNSLDAIKDKKQDTEESVSSRGIIEIKAVLQKNSVVLLIKDDGCGMDKDTLDSAFKPFFTTKTRGTGLGLAIANKLIKSIGGAVELESEPNKGTIFKIKLPKNLIK